MRAQSRLLVGAYVGVAALTVCLGGLLLLLHQGPGPRQGTIEVMASARVPESLAPAPVRVHSASGWLEVSGSAGGAVPAAPDTLRLGSRSLPPGPYDQLEVGGLRLPFTFVIAAGQVEPLLVEVASGRPNPAGVYAGSQDVSLGVHELAGLLQALPAFSLVDQDGRAFDNARVAGRDLVVAAFHTQCHTTCPLYTGLLLQLQHRLPSSTMLLEVTTDPVHDTPAVLRSYAAAIDAGWTFATGDPAAVADFWSNFSVELSNGDSHTSALVLADRHGFIRQPYRGVPRLDQPLDPQLRAQLNQAGQAQLAAGGDGWGASQVLDALHTITSQLESSTAAGGAAPEFVGTDLWGRPIGLAQFRDRALVINFWATWCDPCRRELPLLQRASAAQPGLAVLLVSEGDDAGSARAYLAGLGISLPSALDASGRIGAAYKVGGQLPTSYFVKTNGSIEGRYVGEIDEATLHAHLIALGP